MQRTISIVLIALLAICLKSSVCLGTVLSAPASGSPITLPDNQVACVDATGTWIPDASGKRMRPPLDPNQIGKVTTLRVAPTPAGCAASKESLQLVVSGPIPLIDRKSVDLWLDEGRVEVHGTGLDGSRLEWETKSEHGSDVCAAPTVAGTLQACSYSLSKKLSADQASVTLRIVPAGTSSRIKIFDSNANPIESDEFTIVPARWVVSSQLTQERHVDLSTGDALLALTHPDAIASVDCDQGRCELLEGGLRIRATSGSARSILLKIHLTPHVFARSAEGLVQTVAIPVDITHCPLTVASLAPVRDTYDTRIVVRVDARCRATVDTVRWTSNGHVVPVVDSETKDGDLYMLLELGRVTSDKLTLVATRNTSDVSLIGITSIETLPPPQLRVSLHLTDYGPIDFVPTNRDVTVSAVAPKINGKIVTLPVAGAYSVRSRDGNASIRGDAEGGFVVLQFALRDQSLPGHLDEADLAHFGDHVQRALREVNTPAPIGDVTAKSPIVEILCSEANGHQRRVLPGEDLHIPYAQRNSCRLIIHRERIPADAGEQRMDLNVEVTSLAGSTRSEGHLSQRLAIHHGNEQRVIWLHGVKDQFDRINVDMTHIIDETQYLRSSQERLELPAGHWTIVVEDTRWRFSATAAIPVSLFRFSNDPNGSGTGPLTLNVGVLSRFTWVTRDGTQGVVGLESGVMAMGLSTENTRQLNVVAGIGLGVPLGNVGKPSQASINIHAWAAYRLGNEYAPLLTAQGIADPSGQIVSLKHWSFIFGPSVTFGNVQPMPACTDAQIKIISPCNSLPDLVN